MWGGTPAFMDSGEEKEGSVAERNRKETNKLESIVQGKRNYSSQLGLICHEDKKGKMKIILWI